MSPLKPVLLTPAFPVGRMRPDPCLDQELQERFFGRQVPTRFWQSPADCATGGGAAVELGRSTDRPPIDACFLQDVRSVVYRWLAFWSAFRLPEVRAAFRVEAGADVAFEVRPVAGNADVPFILAALRRNGASLRPTIH